MRASIRDAPTARRGIPVVRGWAAWNTLTVGGPSGPEGVATKVTDVQAEPRGSTTRDGFAVLGVAIRREPVDLRPLHARQPALRRADRRRRLGARLVHRPRRAPGLPRRRDRRRPALGGPRAVPRRRASCARSASSPAGSAPASCSTACRPTTAAPSPGSTSRSRWSGTSATRPASCSPTPTPTSRPPGARSRRCRWRSAPSR